MKNTVKRTYIAWNTRNKTLLRDNIDHRRISDPRSSMTAVYADIAKNSQKIFGKKLTAKHIQKRAYALGVAPGSRARVTSPTRATSSGVTLMFQGRSITEEMLQKALKLYDAVYNT